MWSTRSTANSGILADNLDCLRIAPGGDEIVIGTVGAGFCVYRPEHLFPGDPGDVLSAVSRQSLIGYNFGFQHAANAAFEAKRTGQ